MGSPANEQRFLEANRRLAERDPQLAAEWRESWEILWKVNEDLKAALAAIPPVSFRFSVAESRSCPGFVVSTKQTPEMDRPVQMNGYRSRFGARRHALRQRNAARRAGFSSVYQEGNHAR